MLAELVWLVPLFPLLGFVINGLGFGKLSRSTSSAIGVGSVALSFALVVGIFFQYLGNHQAVTVNLYEWIAAGSLHVNFSFLVDALTLNMLLIVTGVGLLIHIYSAGYMSHDEGFTKFFAYLNLFMFSMLVLVLGSNYLMMFIGWEGVGLCSYLLIGYWFKNQDYTAAANKAFIMNRIGDLGFLLGMFLIYINFGSLEFSQVFDKAASGFSTGDPTIVAITLLLFVGACGKSAQIPLYTWLPDAMAGPTPVSALIHAATMVTAGIYMIVRSNVLFSLAPFTLEVILIIGSVTALLAALIALTQNDIKKVLAYSTVSQLGYMFAAIGASAYTSAMFHVTTHAFFKALLFLCAGSVIHAMSGEQDMRKMGGLKGKLRITFITMLIGTMAITGVPLLSGFFSKDEILMMVWDRSPFAFLLLAITTVLTSIYMFRMLFMTFYGNFRGTHEQEHHLHESPTSMTAPLMILAVLSVIGGYLGLPHLTGLPHALHNFLHPIFEANTRLIMSEPDATTELLVVAGATLALAIVVYVTYQTFAVKPVEREIDIATKPFWYKLSYNKFYVDEIYDNVIVKPIVSGSQALYLWVDNLIVDGTVNGLGRLAMFTSGLLRQVQSGNIGFYVLVMVLGVAGMIFFYVVKGYAF